MSKENNQILNLLLIKIDFIECKASAKKNNNHEQWFAVK